MSETKSILTDIDQIVKRRLECFEVRLDRIDDRLDRIDTELRGLRNDLPSIVAETMREVLKEQP